MIQHTLLFPEENTTTATNNIVYDSKHFLLLWGIQAYFDAVQCQVYEGTDLHTELEDREDVQADIQRPAAECDIAADTHPFLSSCFLSFSSPFPLHSDAAVLLFNWYLLKQFISFLMSPHCERVL